MKRTLLVLLALAFLAMPGLTVAAEDGTPTSSAWHQVVDWLEELLQSVDDSHEIGPYIDHDD